jgi:hypothetical protein
MIEKHLIGCDRRARSIAQATAPAPSCKPDPHDATKCDMCGQRKQSVRSRKIITVGAWSGTVRWKFCDECVVAISLQKLPKRPRNADFLIFYNVEDDSQIFLTPQNAVAKDYLEQAVAADTTRWTGGALVIKETAALSVIRKLVEARFNVVGDRAIVNQRPRLYLQEGAWNIYTGGHTIAAETSKLIVKGAGKPN